MRAIHLPTIQELKESLGSLLGRTTKITKSEGANGFDDSCHTAHYLIPDDELAALCQVDLTLAACLGASLAMVPADIAHEAAKDGDLGANLTDAYSEVANIMSGLLCGDGSPQVRWASIKKSLDSLDDDAKAIVSEPCARIDVEIDIDGYGTGRMTILTASLD